MMNYAGRFIVHCSRGRVLKESKLLLKVKPRTYLTNPDHCKVKEKYYDDGPVTLKPSLKISYTTDEALKFLSHLTVEQQHHLQVLKLEYEVLASQDPEVLPSCMTEEWWAAIMGLDSLEERLSYYRHYKNKEDLKTNKALKEATKDERSQQVLKEVQDIQKSCIHYFNTLPKSRTRVENSKLAKAMQYGRPLVIEMGSEEMMQNRELNLCVTHLHAAYNFNRSLNEPNDLIFTDWIKDSFVYKKLKYIDSTKAKASESNIFMTKTTNESYIDLFPREKLVYIAPFAPNALQEDDPDNVYVINGCYIDYKNRQSRKITSYSSWKLQNNNVKYLKLPIDKYLKWGDGPKNHLHIQTIVKIMCTFMETKNWNLAFKHIPSRFVREIYDKQDDCMNSDRFQSRKSKEFIRL